jgi:hypothetical protein
VLQTLAPDTDADLGWRQANARNVRAWRDRQKRHALLVTIEVEPAVVGALERLALLGVGERDRVAVAEAVCRYLAGAPAFAKIGDVLGP